jgi:hypothetical protein
MFRRLLACVMTAGLVFGGAAPVFASEAGATPSSVSQDGKGKAGKKGKKKGKKGNKKGKKKGKKGTKKPSAKKGGAKKGKGAKKGNKG